MFSWICQIPSRSKFTQSRYNDLKKYLADASDIHPVGEDTKAMLS